MKYLFNKTLMMKTSKTIKLLSIALTFGLFLSACKNDDGPGPEAKGAKSAWMYFFYNITPQGRISYMDVAEKLPSKPDVKGSVELGLNAWVYSIGETVYTVDSKAATFTKWDVDKKTLALKPSGLLSYASTGVGNGWLDRAIFYSKTQVYIPNFKEGLLLEMNPAEMKIVKTHKIPAIIDASIKGIYVGKSEGHVINDKVFWTLEVSVWPACCEYIIPTGSRGAISAVWDPKTETFRYNKDQRLLASDRIPLFDEKGGIYVQPSRGNAVTSHYFKGTPSAPGLFTLLKLDANGNFDPNFSFDLSQALPKIKYYSRASSIYDNKIVLNYATFDKWPAVYADRRPLLRNRALYKTVSVNLQTKEVKPFTLFKDYLEVLQINTVDKKTYFIGFGHGKNFSSTLLRQDGFDDYKVIMKHDGGILKVKKLW